MYEQDREVIGCKATYKVKPSKTNPPKNLKGETILHCTNPLFQVKEKTKQKTPKCTVLRRSKNSNNIEV